MGLWDDITGKVTAARKDAQRKAAELAAKQALNAVKNKVAAIGDDFLDFAEGELAEASEGSDASTELPSEDAADDIAQSMTERLAAAEASARQVLRRRVPERSSADEALARRKAKDDRAARARDELARLKAQLKD
jgi:hypothetical protein